MQPPSTQRQKILELITLIFQDVARTHSHFLTTEKASVKELRELVTLLNQIHFKAFEGQKPNRVPIHFIKKQFKLKTDLVLSQSEQNNSSTGYANSSDSTVVLKQSPPVLWNRDQLEILASGKISSVFGPLFEKQDQYPIQVRMPEPPFLFCDRVLRIEGEPGSLKLGKIWTATDVKEDSWYLHRGHMPIGVFIESGQADLLLVSWLGADFLNQGERAYRLLGCETTCFGGMPQIGDTLEYEIQIDSYAQSGDVRLFFFHYDCKINGKLRLKVREGQAGFFTKKELRESLGVIWDPAEAKYTQNPRLDPPFLQCLKDHFIPKEIDAFTRGDFSGCFGQVYASSTLLIDPPRTPQGKMNLMGEIVEYNTRGGPAGRGYLKSKIDLSPDYWLFQGHFKNDPCMPGTFMIEACAQLLSFYITSLGYAKDKDEWIFETVPEVTFKFICRGQATPESKQFFYELFIDEVISEPHPTVFAHILGSVDGLKAFVCERFAIRLIPSQLHQKNNEIFIDPKPFPWNRPLLEKYASGDLSTLFGSTFSCLDGRVHQLRFAQNHLLLIDQVTKIDAQLSVMKPGTIYSNLTIKKDSWFLNDSYMPMSILGEAGQSFMLLAAWQGLDLKTDQGGQFRALAGETCLHRSLPLVGNTLDYIVTITNYIENKNSIIFSFNFDCFLGKDLVLTLKNGRGGYFTSSMTLEESKGLLWDPKEANYTTEPRFIPPTPNYPKTSFSLEEVQSFAEGNLIECFGHSFYLSETHTRTPKIPSGLLFLLGEITHLETDGGPAKRGYARSRVSVDPQSWYFKDHFKNDPCMPGSLMVEGVMQLMSFYLTSQGFTLNKDGWHFEPVVGDVFQYRCGSQCTPSSKEIIYEIFVDELFKNPYPTLYAHAMVSVDGIKALICERMSIRLVPGWPMTSHPNHLKFNIKDNRPLAYAENLPLDYQALLHIAIGKPSLGMGPQFEKYDDAIESSRLPGPPYHFMTRVIHLDAKCQLEQIPNFIEVLYDVDPDAWYFQDNQSMTMPFCVLLEIALQPCGWLAVYCTKPPEPLKVLHFRNLDGKSTQIREVTIQDKTIKTQVKLKSYSRFHELVILKFDVRCSINDEEIFTVDTNFGFFTAEAMSDQKGIPITNEDRENLALPPNILYEMRPQHPVKDKLLMLDRVVADYPEKGKKGLGYLRGERDVHPSDWYFKAHFFHDPVQPGSLGIEAIIQLLQYFLITRMPSEVLSRGHFEPITLGLESEWHYRGQVIASNKLIIVEGDIMDSGQDENGYFVRAEGTLWVDGQKIYSVPSIGVRFIVF